MQHFQWAYYKNNNKIRVILKKYSAKKVYSLGIHLIQWGHSKRNNMTGVIKEIFK